MAGRFLAQLLGYRLPPVAVGAEPWEAIVAIGGGLLLVILIVIILVLVLR